MDWAAASRAIERRMTELGMTNQDLADAAGLSVSAVKNLLHADERLVGPRKGFRPQTRFSISRALGWTPDSIDRLLEGKRATVDPNATKPSSSGSLPTQVDLADLDEGELAFIHGVLAEMRRRKTL